MTRNEHNAFWQRAFLPTDTVPHRPAGWATAEPTEALPMGYDPKLEFDSDCGKCAAHEPHTWEEHDADVIARRRCRICEGVEGITY